MLEGMKKMYEFTNDQQCYNFIKENIDQYIDGDGNIRTYPYEDFNLDKINPGRALLFIYDKTKLNNYKIAADTLPKQIENQPRTHSGGYWHKQIYPYQMWLDGLFMSGPFYAQYSKLFDEDNYNDILHQYTLVYKKTLEKKLVYYIMLGMKIKNKNGQTKRTAKPLIFWEEQ